MTQFEFMPASCILRGDRIAPNRGSESSYEVIAESFLGDNRVIVVQGITIPEVWYFRPGEVVKMWPRQ